MPSSTRRPRSRAAERSPRPGAHSSSIRPPKWEYFAIYAAIPLALLPFAGPILALCLLWTTRTFRESDGTHTRRAGIVTFVVLAAALTMSLLQVNKTLQGDRWFYFTTSWGLGAFLPQHIFSVLIAWLAVFQAWHWQRQTRIRHQRSQPHPHEGSIPLDDFSTSGPEASDDAHRSSQRNREAAQEEETEAVASGSDGDGGHAATFDLPRSRLSRRNTESARNPATAGSRRARSRSSSRNTLLSNAEAPGRLSRPLATHGGDRHYSSEEVENASRDPAPFL